jgi:hypothetical protein
MPRHEVRRDARGPGQSLADFFDLADVMCQSLRFDRLLKALVPWCYSSTGPDLALVTIIAGRRAPLVS